MLKPQREGGGNNVFGNDIPEAIQVSRLLCWNLCLVACMYCFKIARIIPENVYRGVVFLDFDGAYRYADIGRVLSTPGVVSDRRGHTKIAAADF